ncbi:MAG: hypothetical protein JWP02_3135, partial [Acidimicrobiales bacterium]|nr:hypothetical protein [Acidimicrobiales bacterium]
MRRTGSILVALALVFMGLAALVPAPASAADASSSGAPSTEQIRQKHEAEFRRTHQDSAGNLRPDLWRAGVTQQQDMATTNMSGQQIPGQDGVGPKTAPGVVGATWSQIGPAPVRVDQEQNFQGAGPDSGEVGDVAIDPAGTTDRIVYIVSNDGGVWKTTNGDAAPNAVVWTPLTDNMPSNSMGAIALDPTNSSIVYAGTGNRFNNGFFKGVGLYRSTDGGATWAQPAGNGSLNNRAIYRIVLPSFNVVLVATNGGLFKSVDGGTSYGNNAPTYDNGLAVHAGDIVDLHLGTEGNGRVYASTRGGTLHRSTDSGSTFGGSLFDGNIPAGASYVSFSQATLDTKIIYANIQTPNVPNPPPPGSTQKDGRIFRTSNGDQANPTWANVAAGSANALGCQCGYDQTIGVDPQDNNTVYQGYQELYVTTNGGTSWPKVSASKIHWDHHALTFSPPSHRTGAPTRAWVGQDGGISYTSDRGANFSLPDEGGLATNLFRGLGIGTGSAVNRGYSFGGTQDTGTLHHTNTTPGTDWHLSIDGDGGQVAVDHCDAKHAMGSDNGFFISTPNINTTIFSQTNNGFGTSGTPTVTQVDNMAFDPNCGSRAYVGDAGNGFWQTTDNGANFTKIHTFPAHVVAMSQRVGSPNTMWVGLGDGTTQRSDNLNLGTTSTWTSHAVTGAPAGQQIGYPGGIAMDWADATGNTVVATFEGF